MEEHVDYHDRNEKLVLLWRIKSFLQLSARITFLTLLYYPFWLGEH